MLVEVDNEIEAQRLSNAGYTRTGEEAVEARIDELDDLLELDADGNVTIQKLSLHRANGESEAHTIDTLIDAGYDKGPTRQVTGVKVREYDMSIRARTKKLFNLRADSVTIYRDFLNVVTGNINEVSNDINLDEKLDGAKENLTEKISDRRQHLQKELAQLDRMESDLLAMTADEWAQNGFSKVQKENYE